MSTTYRLKDGPTIIHGECIEAMRTMPADSIDSIVTDPPYGLGFMGKAWDDLPPGLEWAQECLRVLKPGGHILAFGGTRTWHRLAVSIEDAGFEIRDSLAWMHGQGFPKGGSQMKPAFEPVVMGRKPFAGSMAANVAKHGTGSLQIDACRLRTGEHLGRPQGTMPHPMDWGNASPGERFVTEGDPGGRWPANVILDTDMAAVLDQQSGVMRARGNVTATKAGDTSWFGTAGYGERVDAGDTGGASRFFYTAKAPTKERPSYINTEGQKVAHNTVKPLALMRWLTRLVTPTGGTILDPFAGSGTTIEAAMLEGFQVIGIEREAEYLPLINARIERVA